jgi:radical SAM superfamily enzyme YgiQ (UPF0313 family)
MPVSSILLIAPKNDYNYKRHTYYRFPLGIAYISSALKSVGYNVTCIDCHRVENLRQTIFELSQKTKFDFVGLGGMSLMFPQINDAIADIRSILGNITIVLGGAIVTTEPEAVFDALDADIGVLGEGEAAIIEIADTLKNRGDLNQVCGLVLRNPNTRRIFFTPKRNVPRELHNIPMPDYDGFGLEEYFQFISPLLKEITGDPTKFRAMSICGARSCPYQCTFCYHFPNHPYRQRSLDDLFGEINYLISRYQVNYIRFHDEVFCTPPHVDRIFDLCERMKKLNIKWKISLRVDVINEDTAIAMRDSGCIEVLLGLENVNTSILKSMKKNISKEKIENACSILYNNNIAIDGYLLFGDIEETDDIVNENLVWWLANTKYKIGLGLIAVLPNSQLYVQAKKTGKISNIVDYINTTDISSTFINMTQMDDEVRNASNTRIFHLLRTNGLYGGHIISSRFLRIDAMKNGNALYYLKAFCPHCGQYPEYSELFFSSENQGDYIDCGYVQIRCSLCNRFFDIPNIDIPNKYSGTSTYLSLTHIIHDNIRNFYKSHDKLKIAEGVKTSWLSALLEYFRGGKKVSY